ncbi:S9 family peptidase [Lutimonas zeaxanthinifaciens]|uniref:S9 family peptidase n=1 Tax=Lutimonas zeaxanthinifaciens TaxID=3060215 RepID=UPI00265D0FDD|nr:S9 family peptidase [Lutimonas sp. YSD2104]WKK65002.1 S9 family peptidase [Lutimonas sp. YSD2104]
MKKLNVIIIILSITFAFSCENGKLDNKKVKYMPEKGLKPPIAERIPKKMEIHGDVRTDDYYWLNERENERVIDYLNAENSYYDSLTGHTRKFQEDLFEEMKSRIKEDDESVPYKKNGYFYITRYEKGSQYPVYTRKKGNLEAEEEIIVDVNELAKGHEYYALTSLNVNRSNDVAAFGVDTISRRQYDIMFKNLENGSLFPEVIKNTTGSTAWSNDNKTVFYAKKDPITLRSDKIYKHVLGTDASEDELVFEEKDETFWTFVYKSKSQKYIIIGSYSTLSTEYRFLDADKPKESFQIIQPRERELEYSVAHYGNDFYILTNHGGAVNFKLMKTPVAKTGQENWVDVIPHREDTLLEDISIFKDFLVLEERNNGLNKIRIKRWNGKEDFYLPFDEETYTASVYNNPEFDTRVIRYSYNSLTTPNSVIDFNVDDKSKEVKKEQEVLGGEFDKNNYSSERLWAPTRDGKKVAVSLVYRKTTKINENTPLLLYGYGSYGSIVSDRFSSVRLSLLDRGFVYAIAHIRGGEYLGRTWYEDGKMFNKMNTFNDFIDAGKFLIEQKYTSAAHLYAEGGSAGGLLMGAVINMNPEIFNGIIAAVPFIDVVTTMLDESIPLTTGEFDEWGNPKNKDSYQYMLSYSPYDNVKKQDYPHMLVTTGLHDSQVQYFEPAKWVAKLRVNKTDNNLLLLYTNMETGHGGASGRFDALKEVARDYSFLLDLENITE